jgi:hypothetical protein
MLCPAPARCGVPLAMPWNQGGIIAEAMVWRASAQSRGGILTQDNVNLYI